MGSMFAALFAFITKSLSAAERTASAIDNLATWADEASGTFTDKARHERNMRMQAMMQEANITELPKPAKRDRTATAAMN